MNDDDSEESEDHDYEYDDDFPTHTWLHPLRLLPNAYMQCIGRWGSDTYRIIYYDPPGDWIYICPETGRSYPIAPREYLPIMRLPEIEPRPPSQLDATDVVRNCSPHWIPVAQQKPPGGTIVVGVNARADGYPKWVLSYNAEEETWCYKAQGLPEWLVDITHFIPLHPPDETRFT